MKSLRNLVCVNCGLRPVFRELKDRRMDLCFICLFKSLGRYSYLIRELKESDWWGFKTKWNFKVGWSFISKISMVGMFSAVLRCTSLNKTPKVPDDTLERLFTPWQLKVYES